jgi:hypothetical protein
MEAGVMEMAISKTESEVIRTRTMRAFKSYILSLSSLHMHGRRHTLRRKHGRFRV